MAAVSLGDSKLGQDAGRRKFRRAARKSAPGPGAPRLWLDHASIVVPSLAQAISELDAKLGLRATPTPAAPHRHGRVYLDRNYLEVAAESTAKDWRAVLYFLRFEDPATLRRHLDTTSLPYRFGRYTGFDGEWDDVDIDAGPVPVPILVRRTHPPEVARHWPPSLRNAHRSALRTLAAVEVIVPELRPATDIYCRLTGVSPTVRRTLRAAPSVEFRLAAGRILLTEGPEPGLHGLVFGARSLSSVARVLGPLGRGSIRWLAPEVLHGLRIGVQPITR